MSKHKNWNYDEFDFNEPYFRIENSKPENGLDCISSISLLRHFINCHGWHPCLFPFLHLENNGEGQKILSRILELPGVTSIHSAIDPKKREELFKEREIHKASIQEAKEKDARLIQNLRKAKISYCNGLGLYLVKLFLNSRIKKGDKTAELYRVALEAEYKNISAKATEFAYKDKAYVLKEREIRKLCELCQREHITYGRQKSDIPAVNSVIYFELPGMEQISFHTNLYGDRLKSIPVYEKPWDGKKESTLNKIESAILLTYGPMLKNYKKINKL